MSVKSTRAAAVLGSIVAGAIAGCGDGADGSAPARQDALPPPSIHERALTLDSHVDIPLDFATAAVDPLSANLQVNLEKMRAGGLDAAFFIVYVGQNERTPPNYVAAQTDAMTKLAAIRRMTSELYPELIGLAETPDDVERIVAAGKLAAAIGIENGYVIGSDLGLLDRYYELGARYMTLVHDGHNDIADSARPKESLGDTASEHGGVSEFGERVIERMNELGIIVDVSHGSKETALDAIRLSRAPVVASHSGIAGVADHPRNMDDETLLALRDNGGVVQAVAYDTYVTFQPPEQLAAQEALRTRLGLTNPVDVGALPEPQRTEFLRGILDLQQQWPPSDVAAFVDHIDYAVKLIGVDHVGISSDFGGGGGVVGWSDAAETSNVTAELLRRGYSEEDVEKIWSGNFLRVWREVERVAAGQ